MEQQQSHTLFSSLPYEIYHHILSYAVDRELLDPITRYHQIRTIASFQSLNRRICREMKEMQTYFNDFWWKVFEINFGVYPSTQELESMKNTMINKGEMKRKIILANYIKFKVMKLPKYDNPNQQEQKLLKVVVLGDVGVGKSAITISFVCNQFVEEYDPTIEDSYRKQFTVDNIPALLDILDTAAPDEFASYWRRSYMKQAEAFVIVCAVNDTSSLTNLRSTVERMIQEKDNPVNDTPVVFAINKIDLLPLKDDDGLVDSKRKQTKLEEYRNEINSIIQSTSLVHFSIVETSAKYHENVTLVFEEIVRKHRYGTIDNLKLLKKVIDLDSAYIEEYKKMDKKCSLM